VNAGVTHVTIPPPRPKAFPTTSTTSTFPWTKGHAAYVGIQGQSSSGKGPIIQDDGVETKAIETVLEFLLHFPERFQVVSNGIEPMVRTLEQKVRFLLALFIVSVYNIAP